MNTDFIKEIRVETRKDSNEEYHKTYDYASSTTLKKFKESPAHFRFQERKDSEAFAFGSAYHCYILEPEKFDSEYYVFDDAEKVQEIQESRPDLKDVRRCKEYQEWKQIFLTENEGKQMLSLDQMQTIEKMRKVLFHHPFAKSLFKGGEAEVSHYAEIELQTGEVIKAKVRPDYKKASKRLCIDLKTTADASLDGFQRSAVNYGYHLSAALYADILTQEDKGEPYKFFFVAQEKKAPFAFNIFEASNGFLGQGRYEYEMLLLLWNQCTTDEKYPGYQVWCENKYGVQELNLPAYAIKEINYFNHKF